MSPTPPPTPESRRARRRGQQLVWWIVALAVLAVVAIGAWRVTPRVLRLFQPAPAGQTGADATTPAATRRIQATLFYLSDDATQLVPMSRDVAYGATPTEQVQHIVEAEVQPPPAGKLSAIPNGTTVRAVFLTSKGDAYVDLGGTIVSGQTGGSLDEALSVYAIVNAVAANVQSVSAVQLLVDGKQVDTLAGHIDLRYPLAQSLAWIRKGP